MCGEADGRDPTGPLSYASKCLLITSKRVLPPNGFMTSGSQAIVNVFNKRELHKERLTPGTQKLAQFFFEMRRIRVSSGSCGGCGPSSP